MGTFQIFTLSGALGMFLYGMNQMSSGLQKTAGVYYMDTVNELEKMGDFIINVSQSLERGFKKR